jgi:hypothetical protein
MSESNGDMGVFTRLEREMLAKGGAPLTDVEKELLYALIRRGALMFARTVVLLCPPSADRTAALRKVREAVMTANAAIACGGK